MTTWRWLWPFRPWRWVYMAGHVLNSSNKLSVLELWVMMSPEGHYRHSTVRFQPLRIRRTTSPMCSGQIFPIYLKSPTSIWLFTLQLTCSTINIKRVIRKNSAPLNVKGQATQRLYAGTKSRDLWGSKTTTYLKSTTELCPFTVQLLCSCNNN